MSGSRTPARDPAYAEAWALRAELFVDGATNWADPTTTVEQAVDYAKRAISLNSGSQYGHWALAYAYLSQGRRDLFVEMAERAVVLNPNNVSVVGALGAHLAGAGQWERGVELVRQAVALNPNFAEIRWRCAQNHFLMEAYAEAAREYQAAIDLNPRLRSQFEDIIKHCRKMTVSKP